MVTGHTLHNICWTASMYVSSYTFAKKTVLLIMYYDLHAYIYAYMHTYIYIYIYIYMYIYILYMRTYMHTCIRIYIYIRQ